MGITGRFVIGCKQCKLDIFRVPSLTLSRDGKIIGRVRQGRVCTFGCDFSHLPFNIKLHDNCWRQLLSTFFFWNPRQILHWGMSKVIAFWKDFWVNEKGWLINLLVATTWLMKAAILMLTTDVVPSPPLSRIWPPIPSKCRGLKNHPLP